MHSSSNVQLKLSNLSFEKELFRDIFNVALPASLAPIFTVGTILILTGLVGQFGVSALAGYGIGSRIEFLMIPLVFGIGTAMTTMVGTNIGANKVERAERIGWLGGSFAGLFSGMIGLTLILSSSYWINFFATDQATYEVTKQYIEIVGLCFTFQGLGLSLILCIAGSQCHEVANYSYRFKVRRCCIRRMDSCKLVFQRHRWCLLCRSFSHDLIWFDAGAFS